MRVVLQRVSQAEVKISGTVKGKIGKGILALLGIGTEDSEEDARWLAAKISGLRIFEDENGKMNHSLQDIGGELMVISQFTLLGDCRKGRRPSFTDAAPPEKAQALYDYFIEACRKQGHTVATGEFQAMMDISLVNQGPVTFIVDSPSR